MGRKRTPAQNKAEEVVNTEEVESNETILPVEELISAAVPQEDVIEVIERPKIDEPAAEVQKTYKVHVIHPSLRKREKPNLSAYVAGIISDQGVYEIFETVNGWGRLEDGNWIMLSYTEIV